MSGPIVRRYGFPNFEQIFGKRELQHGVDEPDATKPGASEAPASAEKATEDGPGKAPSGGKPTART